MPLPKKVRVEAAADPLAAAKKPETAADPLAAAKAAVTPAAAAPRSTAPRPPRVNRAETFGAAYDPSMKQAYCAHRGASTIAPNAEPKPQPAGGKPQQQPGKASPAPQKLGTSALLGLFGASNAGPSPAPVAPLSSSSSAVDSLLALLRGDSTADGATAVSSSDSLIASVNAAEADMKRPWWEHPSLPTPLSQSALEVLDPTAAVPDVEPWDDALLAAPSYDLGLDDKAIDGLVHHIPHVVGWNPAPDVPPMPLRKTPQERRKERHIRREVAAKERQQNEHLGLAEKQEQRLTLKHLNCPRLMETMKGGPTEIEEMIRKQMEKRVLDHYEANERRHVAALGHQKEHYFEVLARRASECPKVVAYRIDGVEDEYLLTKIKINAKQLLLRGAVYHLGGRAALVVLVGGERPQRRVATIIRNAQWPAGCRVDRLWASNITTAADEALFFPKARAESDKGERVRLVRPKTTKDAMAALENQQLGHVWLAAVRTPVEGRFAQGGARAGGDNDGNAADDDAAAAAAGTPTAAADFDFGAPMV